MLIDRLGPVFEQTGALGFAFRIYEIIKGLDLRAGRQSRPYRRAPPDGLPIPPAHLIVKVAGKPHAFVYFDGGVKAARAIRELLARNHVSCERMGSILDFGCGCGRVLRHWKDLSGTEVHGTDYNPELTRWCSEHIPFARIATNNPFPPTGYSGNYFDLIYALSVFTHLPEPDQMSWMHEFRRILRPGGHLILTTHGVYYSSRLTRTERTKFAEGELVVRYRKNAGTNLCSTFHPPGYVRNVLSAGFEIIDFVPEGAKGNPRQDAWLLRKPAAGGSQ